MISPGFCRLHSGRAIDYITRAFTRSTCALIYRTLPLPFACRAYEQRHLHNFFTGTKDNVTHLLDDPLFELMRHDVPFPLYVEVDETYFRAEWKSSPR
jgi:hypothetical protein